MVVARVPGGTRPRVTVLALLGLILAACSSGGSSSSASTEEDAQTSSTGATTTVPDDEAEAWTEIDDALTVMGPHVGFLAARVDADGACEPVHEVEPATARPIASQFKLIVLGALVDEVAAGRVAWDQGVTVEEADKSFGNAEGSLQAEPSGTTVTVEDAATRMISISDNTATDVLIDLIGRDAVEARSREWVADAAANQPFLTTKQVFLLHYVDGLADRYLATPQDDRADFLATEVDPRPMTDIVPGLDGEPHHVDTIEWFASPDDICRAFAGLQQMAAEPTAEPLTTILSEQVAGIGLEPGDWPTVWYKGGSEPGVLTLGWLATTDDDEAFVVEAMVSDPDAALAEDVITDLVALAEDAFALLG